MQKKHIHTIPLNDSEKKAILQQALKIILFLLGYVFLIQVIAHALVELMVFTPGNAMIVDAVLTALFVFPVLYIAILSLIKTNIIPLAESKRAIASIEMRHKNIINSLDSAVIIANSVGVIVGWNLVAQEVFGYTATEIVGQPIMFLMPHRYQTLHQMAFNRTMSNDELMPTKKTLELEGIHKNGKEFSLLLMLSKWQDDGEYFVTGVVRKITKRKPPIIDLRMAAVTFESPDAKIITDTNQIIHIINPAFTKITGYSAEDIIGKTPAILKSGRHDTNFYKEMWKILIRYGSWQGEIWNRRKNGEIYLEYLSISALFDSDGRVTSYMATFSDITAHKLMELERERGNTE